MQKAEVANPTDLESQEPPHAGRDQKRWVTLYSHWRNHGSAGTLIWISGFKIYKKKVLLS